MPRRSAGPRCPRLLEVAKSEAAQSLLGREADFEKMWASTASMLSTYSDEGFVSTEYARELSTARVHAGDVDQVSDDPPERVQGWMSTVTTPALVQLDLSLLLDLLTIEAEPDEWRGLARITASEVERLVQASMIAEAQQLTEAIVRDLGPEGRSDLREAALSAVEVLVSGPLVRHIVVHLRRADDADLQAFDRLCHTLGPGVIGPLAEALAVEGNNRAIGRLRELILGFGAAGRHSIERLKAAANPVVRRMVIGLLQVFGGEEALPELASMLDDADPQVQRDAVRALVLTGTPKSFALLQQSLSARSKSRDSILQELIGLREDKAIPLLCHVLNRLAPRGRLAEVHAQVIDALGGLAVHAESTRTLRAILHRGEWWAPFRTAALRQAAARALRRIGAPETLAVLEDAARRGSRGVRKAAQAQTSVPTRRGPERA